MPPAWSHSELYTPGDRVTHDGADWIALEAGQGQRPPEWPWIPLPGPAPSGPSVLGPGDSNVAGQTVGSGDPLAWGTADGLLDITDPFAPTIITAGFYVVTVGVSASVEVPGKSARVQLTLDNTGFGAYVAQTMDLAVGAPFPSASLSMGLYLPADAVLLVNVFHDLAAPGDCTWALAHVLQGVTVAAP